MPKLTRDEKERLPSTLERSEEHAQETFVRTLESAEQVRGHEGDERYAHRVAFAAVKHSYAQSEHTGPGVVAPTHEGVDANATKAHLLEVAKKVGVTGRSRMTKDELVEGIQKANRRETARARKG